MFTPSPLTKEQALALFGDAKALAAALKITRSAIYQWPDGAPIPDAQDLRIRYELKPELFGNKNH